MAKKYRGHKDSRLIKGLLATSLILASTILAFSIITNNKNIPKMLWVHLPSFGKPYQNFTITVEAWDEFERISSIYSGTVNFSIISFDFFGNEFEATNIVIPKSYSFSGQLISQGFIPAWKIKDGKDNGIHEFTGMINELGIHYILVEDSFTNTVYYSNPIKISEDPSMLVWGDIHGHSILSDGKGTADESYYYARNIAKLEYASVTDHAHQLDFSNYHERLETSTNRNYDEYEFVTLQGLEWSPLNTHEHFVIIFPDDDLHKLESSKYGPASELWKELDAIQVNTGNIALAIPHHTNIIAWNDWNDIDIKYVKIAEVSSVHGECLFENEIIGSSVTAALDRGFKLSLASFGDNHEGRLGHSIERKPGKTHTSGITGIRVNSLTRAEVFSKLYSGNLISNSDFGRVIIEFNINGYEIGETINMTTNQPRNINIFVAQDPKRVIDSEIYPNWHSKLEIYKNGTIYQEIDINSSIARITVVDNDGKINGDDYYFVRLVNAEGRITYAGCIYTHIEPN